MVTVPVGAGPNSGTAVPCVGLTYPRSTSTVGPPSTANGTSTSYAGAPSTTRSRASTCASGRYRPGGGHPSPLPVGRRRILLWQDTSSPERVRRSASWRSGCSRATGLGVLAELPRRQHREAQVGERDHDDVQRQPLWLQQEREAAASAGDAAVGELVVDPVVQSGQRRLDHGEHVLEVVGASRSRDPRRRGRARRSVGRTSAASGPVRRRTPGRAASGRGCGPSRR